MNIYDNIQSEFAYLYRHVRVASGYVISLKFLIMQFDCFIYLIANSNKLPIMPSPGDGCITCYQVTTHNGKYQQTKTSLVELSTSCTVQQQYERKHYWHSTMYHIWRIISLLWVLGSFYSQIAINKTHWVIIVLFYMHTINLIHAKIHIHNINSIFIK